MKRFRRGKIRKPARTGSHALIHIKPKMPVGQTPIDPNTPIVKDKVDLAAITNGDVPGIWNIEVPTFADLETLQDDIIVDILTDINLKTDRGVTVDDLNVVVGEDYQITITPADLPITKVKGELVIVVTEATIGQRELNLSNITNCDEPGVWELDYTDKGVWAGYYKHEMFGKVMTEGFSDLLTDDNYIPDVLVKIEPEDTILALPDDEYGFYIVPCNELTGFEYTGELYVRVKQEDPAVSVLDTTLNLSEMSNGGDDGIWNISQPFIAFGTPAEMLVHAPKEVLRVIEDVYSDTIGEFDFETTLGLFDCVKATEEHNIPDGKIGYVVSADVSVGELTVVGQILVIYTVEDDYSASSKAAKNILSNMSEVTEFEGRSFEEPSSSGKLAHYIEVRDGVSIEDVRDYYYEYTKYGIDETDPYYNYLGGDIITVIRGESIFFIRADKEGVEARVRKEQSELRLVRITPNVEIFDIGTLTNCDEPGVWEVEVATIDIYDDYGEDEYTQNAKVAIAYVSATYLSEYEGVRASLNKYGVVPATGYIKNPTLDTPVAGLLRFEMKYIGEEIIPEEPTVLPGREDATPPVDSSIMRFDTEFTAAADLGLNMSLNLELEITENEGDWVLYESGNRVADSNYPKVIKTSKTVNDYELHVKGGRVKLIGTDGIATDRLNITEFATDVINYSFEGTTPGLTLPTQIPSIVTDMTGMLSGVVIHSDITGWDVSQVTNMSHMFNENINFNQDISNWNVGNVTDMSGMFKGDMHSGINEFNQDISSWDVSNVTDMSQMFNGCTLFNQDISGWDVSNVTNMGYMFGFAVAFNQDLGDWCVSNIPTVPEGFYSTYEVEESLVAWTLPKPVWGTCPRGEDVPV